MSRAAASASASWRACASRGDISASTVQVMVIPISEASVGYAQEVRATLRAARLHVEVDASDKKMQKKVREAQLAQFNYILVRGPLSHSPHSLHQAGVPASSRVHSTG